MYISLIFFFLLSVRFSISLNYVNFAGKSYLFEELQKSRSFNCFLDFKFPHSPPILVSSLCFLMKQNFCY